MLSSSLSSSLDNVNSSRPTSNGFEVMLPTVLKHYETGKEEEENENENENVVWFSFLLGKHRDRYLNIVGNEIYSFIQTTSASLRHFHSETLGAFNWMAK